MKKTPKTKLNRKPAVASSDLLGRFYSELKAKREYWQGTPDDPQRVAQAVYAALAEVESAIRRTLWRNRKPAVASSAVVRHPYKLPEWTIKLDDMVLGVLYVESLSPTEQHEIGGLLAMHQNVSHKRITFHQVESELLKETGGSADV